MRLLIFFLLFSLGANCQNIVHAPEPEVVDVIVLAGQSNVGVAQVADMSVGEASLYAGERANTYIYNRFVTTDSAQLMNVGVNTFINETPSGGFGLEASLFKSLQDYAPRERYLIKYGRGSTNLIDTWLPGNQSFTDLIDYLENVYREIKSKGKRPRLVAFIWMQGESDALDSSDAANYLTNLTFLMSEFRRMNTIARQQEMVNTWPDLKVIIGRIGPNNNPPQIYNTQVRTAQFDYCAIPANNAIMVDTDGYPLFDVVHYSATGQIEFGLDVFDLIKDL